MLLRNAKETKVIEGVTFVGIVNLTHLIFVDDVLLFDKGTLEEWQAFQSLISLFCDSSRLEVSPNKSCFVFYNMEVEEYNEVKAILDFQMVDFIYGFKYFGFMLKLVGYTLKDWGWIIKKLAYKIKGWSSHYLSLGGRLVHIKSVLQGIPNFLFSLYLMHVSIIYAIRKLIFQFLWAGKGSGGKFHLYAWEILSQPFAFGGWGIKCLSSFNLALCATSLWRGRFNSGLWGKS